MPHDDLEICGLTRAALERFATEASQTRDRVEVFSNRTFRLSQERKQRYKKRGQNGAQAPRASQVPRPLQAPTSNNGASQVARNGGAGGTAGLPPGHDLIVIDSSDEE